MGRCGLDSRCVLHSFTKSGVAEKWDSDGRGFTKIRCAGASHRPHHPGGKVNENKNRFFDARDRLFEARDNIFFQIQII